MAGAERGWFLGRVRGGAYATVGNRVATRMPAIGGTIQQFVQSRNGDDLSKKVLSSKVQVCTTCGKPCGVTLLVCNRCNSDLAKVQATETANLFSAFLLGVESSGTSALQVSIRRETDSLLVFDDPLALSPAHFCAIPTAHFIPDWRYLLTRPSQGLALVRSLLETCHEVLKEQFLKNPAWTASVLLDRELDCTTHTLAGFNLPPSQHQLHVQYIVPPLMPQQFYMFLNQNHFTYGRFFPFSYVEECLKKLADEDASASIDRSVFHLSTDDLISYLETKCSVSYAKSHAEFIGRVDALQHQFGNWTKDNFAGVFYAQEKTDEPRKLLFKAFSGEQSLVDEHIAIAEDKNSCKTTDGRTTTTLEVPAADFTPSLNIWRI